MIIMTMNAVAFGGFLATVSTDINMPPSNIAAIAFLSEMFWDGTPASSFSDFVSFVTVDDTGTPSQTNLGSTGSIFVFANNCITLTFATGTLAANQTNVSGGCLVLP